MKSIIYKSFLPKQETSKSEESFISPPSGIYRPQYNWKDPEQEDNTSQQETQQSQETVISPENSPTWTNPTGTTIISDTNDPIYKTQVVTPRGQHQFKSSDIQVGEMQELLDRFADAGISLRITSGYRPGATTSSGNQSWHASGYALDVTPIAGQTYENLKQQLRNNPELVKWMQDNGFGIIDETTPEMQSRTGATGAHWHIGKDRLAQSGLQAILSAKHGSKFPIYARTGIKTPIISQTNSITIPNYLTSIATEIPGVGTFNKLFNQTKEYGYIGTAENDWFNNWNQTRLNTGRFDNQITQEDINRQAANRNSTIVNISTNNTPLDANGAGAYYNSSKHTISSSSLGAEPNSTIILHEAAHASYAIPQEQKIKEILNDVNPKQKYSLGEDESYWDNEKEVYARLMEARKQFNLDPNHTYTEKEIRQLQKEARKTGKTNNFWDRYDTSTLSRFINEIASLNTNNLPILNNQPSDPTILYARSGRKLNKRSDKVLSRLYETIDKEYRQRHP